MPDKLLFGVRMLAFTQSCKVFRTNAPLQPPLLGESALPLTVTLPDRGSSSSVPARQNSRT